MRIAALILVCLLTTAGVSVCVERHRTVQAALRTLLAESSKTEPRAEFVDAFSILLKDELEGTILSGHAVKINNFVVACVGRTKPNGMGDRSQHLFVFDRYGRKVDELWCEVDYPLVESGYQLLNERIVLDSEVEGSDFVCRLAGDNGGDHASTWTYFITHRGSTRTFARTYGDIEQSGGILCRLRVGDAGFEIAVP